MLKKNRQLIRDQLQKQLDKFYVLLDINVPHRGWIKSIREALGMSGRQLATRMNISKQRISIIEQQELEGSVTLNTMRKSAEALNSVFVYCVIPSHKLDEIVHNQAKKLANNQLKRISHTMLLENQELSQEDTDIILNKLIKKIIKEQSNKLWDHYDQN